MYSHNWTKAFVLAVLLALPSTASMAVEWVIIPCTPQLRPDECGLKVSASPGEDVTVTTNSGEVVNVAPGTTVSVSGSGIVSTSNQQGNLTTFASADSGPQTTGSIGGAGVGGGAGSTGQIPSGGNNSGGENRTGTTGGGTITGFTTTSGTTSSGGSSGSTSAH